MKSLNLIFPHQLFPQGPHCSNGYPVYLIEEYLFFREFNFHRQKIAFHRASMKAYAEDLKARGLTIHYIESSNDLSDIRRLIPALAQQGIQTIYYFNPTDNWLEKRIRSSAAEVAIELVEWENPLFINSREDLKTFFKPDKKTFFQTSFYKQQRKHRDILLTPNQEPHGGQWTYDKDNRKKYPKTKTPPVINFPKSDQYWEEAKTYVQKYFSNHPGQLDAQPWYPYTKATAEQWLQQFLDFRFQEFGPYEDAMLAQETFLNHSVLTPMMNVGLLAPMDVLNRAISYARQNQVPINSLEGFVRQILGWREFIRGMYECKGSVSRTANFFGFSRKIPSSFYEATTGIDPIDQTIQKVDRYAYCHHIERLMVLGNFMLLCEFDPKEVYRWFMELFIDAYDWVMVPNVYGMSQFADGGFFATKPYLSGSNYIRKMSNYSKGPWQKTWDGLFWRFIDLRRDFFLSNPRLSMMVLLFDKMDEAKKTAHLESANAFLQKLDQTLVQENKGADRKAEI